MQHNSHSGNTTVILARSVFEFKDLYMYSTGQGFFHQSACTRVQRGPMERIKILHPAMVNPESAGTRRPRCVNDR